MTGQVAVEEREGHRARSGALVELRDAIRDFPGSPPTRALGPVTLRIEAGEYVSVMGPSGSGKSTLLNILGLLDTPTAGSYTFGGDDAGLLDESARTGLRGRGIGFVFQSFHLLRRRTATENVAIGLLYRGDTDRRSREEAARRVLERVGLAHRADALAGTLSGGEQQRVAIARALVGGPSLLLCDEPTGALDQTTGRAVLDLIADLHRDGMTVCVITHDPTVAAQAQRTVRLRDGLLVSDEPT